jgi:hypothetical protein
MAFIARIALCCVVSGLLPGSCLWAQSGAQSGAQPGAQPGTQAVAPAAEDQGAWSSAPSSSAASASATTAAADAAAPSPLLRDAKGYVAREFGASFTLDSTIAPMFGDLDGDGDEDLVLVATSPTPLLSQEQFRFRVEDPYDGYFGVGDTKITSQFTIHGDGSARCLLIVFGWRQPPTARDPKRVSKFVLINTPFERVSLASLRLKKKNIQAIEAVDLTTLHALIFWDGRRWRWEGQGMDENDSRLGDAPRH